MKRFCYLALLMLLSSSAYAGNSVSFVVGGHRIRIEAPRYCNSPSCVSVSILGIFQTHRRDDRYRDDDIDDAPPEAPPAKPPAPAQVSVQPVVPPVSQTSVAPVASAPPPILKPAASATSEVITPPLPQIQPPKPAAAAPPTISVEKPADAARPAPDPAPRISRVSHQTVDEPADTPLGVWQTEGKGSIRIEPCGSALCGYALDPSSNGNGEAVLINMKPKAASQWSGNVYSHDSGDIYYGTMAMQGPDMLRVEACALGRFYCSGNLWSRIDGQPRKLMTGRQIILAPRT